LPGQLASLKAAATSREAAGILGVPTLGALLWTGFCYLVADRDSRVFLLSDTTSVNQQVSTPTVGWISLLAVWGVKATHRSNYLSDEISGSHGGVYEDDCLLGCCAV
jgi:hypothetical protein